MGETRGKEPKNVERQPDTMEKPQFKPGGGHSGKRQVDWEVQTQVLCEQKRGSTPAQQIEQINITDNRLSITKLASISGTLVNTQTKKSGTRSRNIKICNRIIYISFKNIFW